MPTNFSPIFTISALTAQSLARIEVTKERAQHLPVTPTVLASLRETARLMTTHYSTMIEGNRLTLEEVTEVIQHAGHFPGKERDQHEINNYYNALHYVEKCVSKGKQLTEKEIQIIHAIVMGKDKKTATPTPYRDGQNVIKDGQSRTIVYLPPEAKDVPILMKALVDWINSQTILPAPIIAALAHYQFATIHPYFDGNGRTARLLTAFILHKNGYSLKGIFSLEEYYARNLEDYYQAITIGPSHNYYLGRAEADLTQCIEYFISGMARSFEAILKRMKEAAEASEPDKSDALRSLDPRQRKVLALFLKTPIITAKQICELFGFQPRTGSHLCKLWVEQGFLEVVNASNKARSYKLAHQHKHVLTTPTLRDF